MRRGKVALATVLFVCLTARQGIVQPAGAAATTARAPWDRVVEIDPAGIKTEQQFNAMLQRQGIAPGGYANWYTGRWPYISFLGGMAMGNVSEDLQFFYEKPFRWWTHNLDYVMEDGGRKYGIRAVIRPYKAQGTFPGRRSYLLWYRCDTLLADYHPSYILINGRRVWDCRTDPLLDGKILVPFWQDAPGDPVIDFVVDLDYTPEVKGLALRMFNTRYLGDPGVKVSLKGAHEEKEPSPADSRERFAFGVFSSGYDFWSDRGVPIAELKKTWKPNFRPMYPIDDVWLSPFVFDNPAQGAYHDFMVTYGGCNLLGASPGPAIVREGGSYLRGALVKARDIEAAKKVLALAPGFEAHWFGGEDGLLVSDNGPADPQRTARLTAEGAAVEANKQATGAPKRVRMLYEPFPPALSSADEYARGRDILVLKNEEDPQYNILMSMARGAGRSFGKPFGFYWEQTHYPYPSLDFKLQACLLYYMSGGSWIGAEAEDAPAFADGVVAEWVLPYVKALRFAMVHPARGTPIVPIAICWGYGDRWWAPYNPLGHMDTFQRSIEYDQAAHTVKSEPAFVKPLPWMPADRRQWNFDNTGHLAYFIDHVEELKGYDLLDVFFPQYGDAFTAHIARLLTGTPCGPLDFVDIDRVSTETLQTYGVAAFLGHANLNRQTEQRLETAARSGTSVLLGAQHLRGPTAGEGWLGLKLPGGDPTPQEGAVYGIAELFHNTSPGRFAGRLFHPQLESVWEIVAWIGAQKTPLVVRRAVGKGAVYVFLGEWMAEGGDVLRPLLNALGERAAPLRFSPMDDQLEYVAYRKGAGAWVALFNHGAIPIGCDRLKPLRATPPEPLCSVVKGPWTGEIEFRLTRFGLDSTRPFALYEVDGIDGVAFEKVVAGQAPFQVRQIPFERKGDVLRAHVVADKRAQFVIAPPGQGQAVFFGKP